MTQFLFTKLLKRQASLRLLLWRGAPVGLFVRTRATHTHTHTHTHTPIIRVR